jgi:hypothetical protein
MDASMRGASVLFGREGSKDSADAAAALFRTGAGKAAAGGTAAAAAAGNALTMAFGYVSNWCVGVWLFVRKIGEKMRAR